MAGLPEVIMDSVQLAAWTVGAGGGLVAAFKAIRELKENREQRARELNWKQAAAAKELVDDLQADARANDAMTMLDWSGRRFLVGDKEIVVTTERMTQALRTDQTDAFQPDEVFIRDCFDHLFFHLDRMGHFVEGGLVRHEDVAYPLQYYVRRMVDFADVFDSFLAAYGYERARELLQQLGFRGGQSKVSSLPVMNLLHGTKDETPATVTRGGFGSTAKGRSAGG